jgi:hypothetical protein
LRDGFDRGFELSSANLLSATRRNETMEFQQVLGIRRSIRYFDPDRTVEPEKIQKILEACRIA